MTKLNCPNCGKEMVVEYAINYNGATYDKWACPDCTHIVVLDYIAESKEKVEYAVIYYHSDDVEMTWTTSIPTTDIRLIVATIEDILRYGYEFTVEYNFTGVPTLC